MKTTLQLIPQIHLHQIKQIKSRYNKIKKMSDILMTDSFKINKIIIQIIWREIEVAANLDYWVSHTLCLQLKILIFID